MSEENLLQRALSYSEYFPVIPVGQNKVPLIKEWQQNSTQEKLKIKDWHNQGLMPLYGFHLKPSLRIFVLDIDNHGTNGFNTLNELGYFADLEKMKANNELVAVQTPNDGTHLYFKHSEPIGDHPNLWKGVDVLQANSDISGRFVLAPGSKAPNKETGEIRTYRLVQGSFEAIPRAPTWLIEAIQQQKMSKTYSVPTSLKKSQSGALSWNDEIGGVRPKFTGHFLLKVFQGVNEGSRNNWLTSVCGTLFNQLLPPSAIFSMLEHINEEYVQPPLTEKELITIFDSIASADNRTRYKLQREMMK